MAETPQASASVPETLLQLTILQPLEVRFTMSSWITGSIVVLILLALLWKIFRYRNFMQKFEIDQAEVGLGSTKLKLAINETDRQIAYKIWVELSTRKIGLPIDLEHDVIAEVYDSWHASEQIVGLSIGVLNDGLRPHLTRWQARFRRWYGKAADHTDFGEQSPQEIQQKFPKYDELQSDLLAVNQRLMAYRKIMYELVVFTHSNKGARSWTIWGGSSRSK